MKRGEGLERRTELGPGQKSIDRRSTFRPPSERARRGRRPKPISAASDEQRDAALLHDRCSACGRRRSLYWTLDPAHLTQRARGGCDDALCTPFALCRRSDGTGCHRLFDEGDPVEGRLDLLSIVNAQPDRYRQALQHALEHLNPVELVERLAGERTQWSGRA